MKDKIIPENKLIEAVKNGRKKGCNELVLSGGEPTLYPQLIINIINLAEALGYQKYIIQTNGYGFVENPELVYFLDTIAQKKEICISFSVHGHCSEIHDELSRNKGAFDRLNKALAIMAKTNCLIYTNTVITTKNITYLRNIINIVQIYNPKIIQFAMLHLEEKNELTVSLLDSVRAVEGIKDYLDLNILKTEGIPYCLMKGLEKCVGESFWPDTLDLYNDNNKYMNDFKQLEFGMRKKKVTCSKCIFNNICMGVWKEHFNEFVSFNLKPIC